MSGIWEADVLWLSFISWLCFWCIFITRECLIFFYSWIFYSLSPWVCIIQKAFASLRWYFKSFHGFIFYNETFPLPVIYPVVRCEVGGSNFVSRLFHSCPNNLIIHLFSTSLRCYFYWTLNYYVYLDLFFNFVLFDSSVQVLLTCAILITTAYMFYYVLRLVLTLYLSFPPPPASRIFLALPACLLFHMNFQIRLSSSPSAPPQNCVCI